MQYHLDEFRQNMKHSSENKLSPIPRMLAIWTLPSQPVYLSIIMFKTEKSNGCLCHELWPLHERSLPQLLSCPPRVSLFSTPLARWHCKTNWDPHTTFHFLSILSKKEWAASFFYFHFWHFVEVSNIPNIPILRIPNIRLEISSNWSQPSCGKWATKRNAVVLSLPFRITEYDN